MSSTEYEVDLDANHAGRTFKKAINGASQFTTQTGIQMANAVDNSVYI